MAGTLGWIMDAPAATAYAVDPVGVETIRPTRMINQNYSQKNRNRNRTKKKPKQ